MKNPLALLSALAAAGILLVAGALYFADPNLGALKLPHFGRGSATSEIFLPVKPSLEERIVRHPLADGTTVDEVEMRDGTTKTIVYDSRMILRHVFAYYPAPKGQVHGAVMYEKTHDAQNHLLTERHLRTDGSLEMDGFFRPDGVYVRHQYFPVSAVTGAPSADARLLQVSVEQTFDKSWKPVTETDFRQDGTRQLLHTWDGTGDLITTFGPDGNTVVSAEGKTNSGAYYTVSYFPGSLTTQMELTNDWQGTSISYYRQDKAHSLILTVVFDNSDNDQIYLPGANGKPEYRQVWSLDWSGQPYPGNQPRRLDHIDHLNADGRVDIKYEFDRKTQKITKVTYYTDANQATYGSRIVYTVGDDGSATSVETIDTNNKSDNGKPLAPGSKTFALPARVTTRPNFTVPALKEGLKLYGDPPREDFDFD